MPLPRPEDHDAPPWRLTFALRAASAVAGRAASAWIAAGIPPRRRTREDRHCWFAKAVGRDWSSPRRTRSGPSDGWRARPWRLTELAAGRRDWSFSESFRPSVRWPATADLKNFDDEPAGPAPQEVSGIPTSIAPVRLSGYASPRVGEMTFIFNSLMLASELLSGLVGLGGLSEVGGLPPPRRSSPRFLPNGKRAAAPVALHVRTVARDCHGFLLCRPTPPGHGQPYRGRLFLTAEQAAMASSLSPRRLPSAGRHRGRAFAYTSTAGAKERQRGGKAAPKFQCHRRAGPKMWCGGEDLC